MNELMDDVQVRRTRLQSRIHLLHSNRRFWNSKYAESAVQQGLSPLSGRSKIDNQFAVTTRGAQIRAYDIENVERNMQKMHAMIQRQENDLVKLREDTLRVEKCNRWMALLDDSHNKRSKFHKTNSYAVC
jgi:hypothetical protein